MSRAKRKQIQHSIAIAPFLMLVGLFSACKREEPTTWKIDALFPIAQGNISFADLTQDQEEYLVTDADGLMHLLYTDTLQAFDLDTLVQLPDTIIENAFSLPFAGGPFSVPPGNELYNDQSDIALSVNNVQLREAKLSSGFLFYKLKSTVDGELNIQFDLPGVIKNGAPLSLNVISSSASEDAAFVDEGIIDLSDYSIDLTGSSGVNYNRIAANYLVTVYDGAAQNAEVFGSDTVSVELSFVDARVAFARGFFGDDLYDLSENIALDALADVFSGEGIQLEEISLNLKLENHLGVDAQVLIHQLQAQREGLNGINLNHAIIGNPINVTRAALPLFPPEVLPTSNEYFFDQDNSNVLDFIGLLPHNIDLVADLQMNPFGDISGGNDFIYTDETFKLILNLDVPLCMSVDGLILQDTLYIESDLSELPESSGDVHLYLENHFPLGGQLQLYLTSEEGDVLVADDLFEPGIQNAFGTPISPNQSQVSIHLSEEDFELLQNGAQFILRIALLGGGEQLKITGNEHLKAKIVADVNTTLSVE